MEKKCNELHTATDHGNVIKEYTEKRLQVIYIAYQNWSYI